MADWRNLPRSKSVSGSGSVSRPRPVPMPTGRFQDAPSVTPPPPTQPSGTPPATPPTPPTQLSPADSATVYRLATEISRRFGRGANSTRGTTPVLIATGLEVMRTTPAANATWNHRVALLTAALQALADRNALAPQTTLVLRTVLSARGLINDIALALVTAAAFPSGASGVTPLAATESPAVARPARAAPKLLLRCRWCCSFGSVM
jgi:hypothetical protein